MEEPLFVGFIITIYCLFALFSFPYISFSFYKLHGLWHKTYFAKRRKLLVLAAQILAVIYAFTHVTRFTLLEVDLVTNFLEDDVRSALSVYGTIFITAPAGFLWIQVVLLRFWILYWDMELAKYVKNKEWRRSMDPKTFLSKAGKHWIVRWQRTLGNEKFLLALVTCFTIATIGCMLAVSVASGGIAGTTGGDKKNSSNSDEEFLLLMFIGLSMAGLYVIPVAYTSHRIKKMTLNHKYDRLGIKKELKMVLYVVVAYICLGCPLLLGLVLIKDYNDVGYQICFILYEVIVIVLVNMYFYVSVALVEKINQPQNNHPNTPNVFPIPMPIIDESKKHANNEKNGNKKTKLVEQHSVTGSRSSGIAQMFGQLVGHMHGKVVHSPASPSTSNATLEEAQTVRMIYSHWKNCIVTTIGYEAFIDHLETEFSVENLLLTTEYIHVKNVLRKHFGSILHKMLSEQKDVSYHVHIPQDDKIIPHSMIAQILDNDIIALSKKLNSTELYNIQPNTLYVGHKLTHCFRRLYNKYVDNSAMLAINISDYNRKSLTHLFDPNSYRKPNADSGSSSPGNASPTLTSARSASRSSRAEVFSRIDDEFRTYLTSRQQIEMEKSALNLDFSKAKRPRSKRNSHSLTRSFSYRLQFRSFRGRNSESDGSREPSPAPNMANMANISNTVSAKHSDDDGPAQITYPVDGAAIEWFLEKVLVTFEKSAREISSLMKDSFSRFRNNANEMKPVVEAAKVYFHNKAVARAAAAATIQAMSAAHK